jgi:hypothetical protein
MRLGMGILPYGNTSELKMLMKTPCTATTLWAEGSEKILIRSSGSLLPRARLIALRRRSDDVDLR